MCNVHEHTHTLVRNDSTPYYFLQYQRARTPEDSFPPSLLEGFKAVQEFCIFFPCLCAQGNPNHDPKPLFFARPPNDVHDDNFGLAREHRNLAYIGMGLPEPAGEATGTIEVR